MGVEMWRCGRDEGDEDDGDEEDDEKEWGLMRMLMQMVFEERIFTLMFVSDGRGWLLLVGRGMPPR